MEDPSTTAHAIPSVGEALREGLAMMFRYWKVTGVYWLLGFVLALVAALPLRATLLAYTGRTLLLDELIPGFNYTYLNDFLQNYGSALTPILNQSLLILVLQFLLLLFLVGGLTKTVVLKPAQFEGAVFWSGSGMYFWRMLRLSLFFTVLHALVLGVFAWLYLSVTKGLSPAELDNEAIITTCLRWLVPLYVLFAAIPMLWHDYAKVQLVNTDARWIWPPIGQSWRFLLKHFAKVYLLYVFVLFLGLIILGLNYLVNSVLVIQSSGTIILSFLSTQLFVILRFALKVLNMGSVRTMIKTSDQVVS